MGVLSGNLTCVATQCHLTAMWPILLLWAPVLIAWSVLRARRAPIDVSHNLLFVTAHPDDELMFFGPTLLQEIRARVQLLRQDQQPQQQPHSKVHLLCLSHGDFYGDGHKRAGELAKACHYLIDYCAHFQAKQLDADIFQLKVLQDEHLPDSPSVNWPPEVVRKHVSEYIVANKISKVITFDQAGVSGHPNHVAIHQALRGGSLPAAVELWQLETVPLWRKYMSWVDSLSTVVQSLWRSATVHLVSPQDYLQLVQSLRQHRSQMLWFRYLYALSSRYMFINSLTRVV